MQSNLILSLLPPVLYYWTLFFPSLSGAAILLIAAMLGGYGGIICALLFPWLARSIFTQYHRITTYQRCLAQTGTVSLSGIVICRNCNGNAGYCWFLLRWCASFLSQAAQPDLLGNPPGRLVPFTALLLRKNNAQYPPKIVVFSHFLS